MKGNIVQDQHTYPLEPQENDPRFFVPQWLQEAHEEDEQATQEMTLEEAIAYYEERANHLQVVLPVEEKDATG
jgi:hypothetical protein